MLRILVQVVVIISVVGLVVLAAMDSDLSDYQQLRITDRRANHSALLQSLYAAEQKDNGNQQQQSQYQQQQQYNGAVYKRAESGLQEQQSDNFSSGGSSPSSQQQQQQQQQVRFGAFDGYTKNSSNFCFKSESSCSSYTGNCSSHGSCLQNSISQCYQCQCQPGYTGLACSYNDYVVPFNIILWTSLALVIIVAGAVGALMAL
ncbi:hypothetical protein MP228_007048 [Amoeboaphelidium protococcarum]|nr:hypothetical protein MP228_007048 [Amoeboaphelidium protococcarum]